MSTPVPRSRRRRFPAPGAAAPRQPVDQAQVGRRAVRRRATGMTATEAAAALEDARLQQHMDRDREDLAEDERGPAEVAEWERITQLLTTTGGVYDPAGDPVVQDELAAEAAAAAEAEEELRDLEREQERQEWLHSNGLPERAHMLMTLEKAGLLGRTEGRHGAEGPLVLHEHEDDEVLDDAVDSAVLTGLLTLQEVRTASDPSAAAELCLHAVPHIALAVTLASADLD